MCPSGLYGECIVEAVETLGLSGGCIVESEETLRLSGGCIVELEAILGLISRFILNHYIELSICEIS